MKLKILSYGTLAAVFLANSISFGDIDRNDNGDYVLTKCGLSRGAKFQLKVDNQTLGGGQVSQDGCMKFTFRNGNSVRPGDHIVVDLGSNRFSETVPGSRGGSSGGNTGTNRPPVPQGPQIDLNKVRESAENQARMMANKVAKLYGRAENLRYNFYRGLFQGANLYNLSNIVLGNANTTYNQGAQVGAIDGATAGASAGASAGANEGSAAGSRDAEQRFRNAMDAQLNTDYNAPSGANAGIRANIADPKSIQQRIAEKDSDITRILYGYAGTIVFDIEGYSFSTNLYDDYRLSLNDMMGWGANYRLDLVYSYYRSEWAFAKWKNRSLGGNYENMIQYYSRICSESYDACRVFESTFKSVYDSVIDQKMDAEVRTDNIALYNLGVQTGMKIASEFAYDSGYVDSYRANHVNASVAPYGENYRNAHRSSFAQRVEYLQTHMEITNLTATLVDASKILPGAPITVVVNEVHNIGAQGGKLKAYVSGSALQGEAKGEVEVTKLSRNAKDQALVNIATVKSDLKPYDHHTVTVAVGGKIREFSVEINWQHVVATMATTGDTKLKGYIITQFANEFNNAGGDFYKQGKNSLLQQIVNVRNSLDSAGKAQLASIREDLRKQLGEKPNKGFWGAIRSLGNYKTERYNGANALVDQLR